MGAQSEGATALPRRVQRAAFCGFWLACVRRASQGARPRAARSAHASGWMEGNERTRFQERRGNDGKDETPSKHRSRTPHTTGGAAHFGLKECSGACTLAYAQQVATQ